VIPVRVPRDMAPTLANDRVWDLADRPDQPVHGTECLACGQPMTGKIVLVYVGREPDGRVDGWTTGTAVPVHQACARPGGPE
jgi:hypothetical protein